MKSLYKMTLLASLVALASSNAIGSQQATASTTGTVKAESATQPAAKDTRFKSDDEKMAYALGASFGHYIDKSITDQKAIGIELDRAVTLQGFQEAFENKSKMKDEEIQQTLQSLAQKVKEQAQKKAEEDTKKYVDNFLKEKDVKKSDSGLLYRVEKAGEGAAPKDTDTVVVHYRGALVNGTEFDSSYARKEPLSFRLDGVIPGWTEGLKYIAKGGKIKLVIPPALAYGDRGVPGAIPPNSTLVFDVELVDIKPEEKPVAPKAEEEPKAAAGTEANKPAN